MYGQIGRLLHEDNRFPAADFEQLCRAEINNLEVCDILNLIFGKRAAVRLFENLFSYIGGCHVPAALRARERRGGDPVQSNKHTLQFSTKGKKLIIFENSNSQSRGALHEAEYMIKLLVQKQELEGRQDAQDMLRMQQQVQQQQQMQQQQVDKRFEEVQDEEEDSDDDDDFDLGDTQVVDDLLNSFAPKD